LKGKQFIFPHVLYATKRDINLASVERRKIKTEKKREADRSKIRARKKVKKATVFLAVLPIIAVEC
jgi:hypothetical protein